MTKTTPHHLFSVRWVASIFPPLYMCCATRTTTLLACYLNLIHNKHNIQRGFCIEELFCTCMAFRYISLWLVCISIASCTVCLVFLLTLEQVWLKPLVTGMQTLVVMVHLRHFAQVNNAVTRVSYPLKHQEVTPVNCASVRFMFIIELVNV